MECIVNSFADKFSHLLFSIMHRFYSKITASEYQFCKSTCDSGFFFCGGDIETKIVYLVKGHPTHAQL